MKYLYEPVLGEYWDPERRHIENSYADIPLLFGSIKNAAFEYKTTRTAEQYLGYLRTWSSTHKYIKINSEDPVLLIEDDLLGLWGNSEKIVRFPIFLKWAYNDKQYNTFAT